MSLLERVRPAHRRSGRAAPNDAQPWWLSLGNGASAAAGSWLVLVLPALLVWVATAHTTVGWGDAVAVASATWFLSHGGALSIGPSTVSIVPLGLWALALAVTTRGVAQLLARTEAAAKGTTWPGLLARRHLPAFAAGYAAVAAAVWLLTLAGPARPSVLGLVVVLTVPALALLICLVRRHLRAESAPFVGAWIDRLPRWVGRGLAPGLWGAGVLLLLGATLVLIMLLARFSTVSGLYAALGTGLFGALMLTLAQLCLLPNLALWALSWIAGPGFSVSDGSAITLAGAHPGLMPMIPFLGALPTEGTWTRWLSVVLLLPVAVGVLMARRACQSVARLSSWRTKLLTASAAAVTAAAALGLLAALGTGAAGVDRLRHVGPSPLALAGALLGELLVGAVLYVAVDQIRQRRR